MVELGYILKTWHFMSATKRKSMKHVLLKNDLLQRYMNKSLSFLSLVNQWSLASIQH